MALRFKYTAKDEIPAEHSSLYVERDGAFMLDAEGVVEKARFDESRASNAALTRERDELRKRFEGIDPDAVKALEAEKQRLEEEQRLKDGKFDEVLGARLKTARSEWDRQHAAVVGERDALHRTLSAIQIDQAAIAEATKRGLRVSAIPDITARARAGIRLVEGAPKIFEADGQTPRAGRDGVTPMTLAEWVGALVSDAPHLFEANAGGPSGAGGPGGRQPSNGATGRNPFKRESWNLTEQMRIQKTDPQTAARLKASA
jgi:hypothetical protein